VCVSRAFARVVTRAGVVAGGARECADLSVDEIDLSAALNPRNAYCRRDWAIHWISLWMSFRLGSVWRRETREDGDRWMIDEKS